MGKNFRIKSRFVGYVKNTNTQASTTYSSVVSRESVRIALITAAFNDLDILSSNIQNAYLTADCREQVWVAAGPKFGSESVKNILMRKVLCVLKSSGVEFRDFLA